MATAGSVDVLSGILVGICAQSAENHTLNTCAGAFINGLAGEMAQAEVGSISMLSSDTASKIPNAIEKIVSL
jgi:NAD(P)H-hydrate epimerase